MPWVEICKTCLPSPAWPSHLRNVGDDTSLTPEGIRIRDYGDLFTFTAPNGYTYKRLLYKLDAVEYLLSGEAVADLPKSDGTPMWTTDAGTRLHWTRQCHYFNAEDREDSLYRLVSASYPRLATASERRRRRPCSHCDPRKREETEQTCPRCYEVPSKTGVCSCA
jgi:hypothetical protein